MEVPLRHDTPVRIVVCGPPGSGKTSLIAAAATESFPDHAPPVLSPTLLQAHDLPDRIAVLLVDTSSRIEDRGALQAEVARAESIVLTYAVDSPASVLALKDEWLPELRRFNVPIIVVGCKLDRQVCSEGKNALPEEHLEALLEYRDVERCLVCSARTLTQVLEVVHYAQKAVLHPVGPLYDTVSRVFQPACRQALKRVFRLCDADGDGALSDAELNQFQLRCFSAPLSADEMDGVKLVVSERLGSAGVTERGLSLEGFLYLHELFIDYGRMETTWTVLRKFGYDNHLRLGPEAFGDVSFTRALEQCVELTDASLHFLESAFAAADTDRDGLLSAEELEELFSTAPGSPICELGWPSVPGPDDKGMPLNSFLANWALAALLRPQVALAYLLYLGLPCHPHDALKVSRRRKAERKRRRHGRSVLQCFVIGSTDGGRLSFVDDEHSSGTSNRDRTSLDEDGVGTTDRFSAAMLDYQGGRFTLVLREMTPASASRALADPGGLASADVVAVLYDEASLESLEVAKARLMALAEARADVPVVLTAVARPGPGRDCEQGLRDNGGEFKGFKPSSVAEVAALECRRQSEALCSSLAVEPPTRFTPAEDRHIEADIYAALVAAALMPAGRVPELAAHRLARARAQLLRKRLGHLAAGSAVIATGLLVYQYLFVKGSESSGGEATAAAVAVAAAAAAAAES